VLFVIIRSMSYVFRKAFTVVELLIVIAIISILASVILGSASSAREGGVGAKIKSELMSLVKRANIEESSLLTYDMVCGSNGVTQSAAIVDIETSIERFSPEAIVCNSSTEAFAVSAALSATEYWCVDNQGASRAVPAALTTELACP
jgi:prepilin-type N-terminal cleavage/methylation domain-containing protein